LDVGIAIRIAWLRRRAAGYDDYDDYNSGSDDRSSGHWSCDPRSNRPASSASRASRSANRRPGPGLHLDARLLAMEWGKLCLGVWRVGQTTPYHGCLGPGTLGE